MNEDPLQTFCEKMTGWGARFIVDTGCTRFRHPSLAHAYAVWREHAGPDGIASRKAMNSRVMQPFQAKLAWFERIEQPLGPPRWRAVHTGPEFTLAHADMTGKYLDQVLPRTILLRWKTLADFVLDGGKPIRYLTVTDAFQRANSVLEHLLVPLTGDHGAFSHLMLVGNFERGAEWKTVVAEEAAFGHRAYGQLTGA